MVNGERSPVAEAFTPQTVGTTSSFVPPPPDPTAGFSSQAQQAIAGDIATEDQTQFSREFSVRCLTVSQSEKKFNGYGISTDLIVVSARFRITALNTTKFTKDFKVSASIETGQFEGLTSDDTIQHIVSSLEKQIQEDKETLSVFQKVNPQ
jgi:hypothetical protein